MQRIHARTFGSCMPRIHHFQPSVERRHDLVMGDIAGDDGVRTEPTGGVDEIGARARYHGDPGDGRIGVTGDPQAIVAALLSRHDAEASQITVP